jgi:tetratricopeptide (TPR) repeat protein
LFAGCTAYHDANNSRNYSAFSGGFSDKKIDNGIYEIDVASAVNVVVSKSSVERVWDKRAKELCLGDFQKYKFKIDENINNKVTDITTQVTFKYYRLHAEGYAICNNGRLAYDEAISVIETPARLKAEKEARLNAFSSEDIERGCSSDLKDIDQLESVGEVLFKRQLYQDAMRCFLNIYNIEKESPKKVDIYKKLGVMYEMGLGVEVDTEQASYWYKLAGFNQ